LKSGRIRLYQFSVQITNEVKSISGLAPALLDIWRSKTSEIDWQCSAAALVLLVKFHVTRLQKTITNDGKEFSTLHNDIFVVFSVSCRNVGTSH
jgi:hypothetical protein